jgi:hypothetical protein
VVIDAAGGVAADALAIGLLDQLDLLESEWRRARRRRRTSDATEQLVHFVAQLNDRRETRHGDVLAGLAEARSLVVGALTLRIPPSDEDVSPEERA